MRYTTIIAGVALAGCGGSSTVDTAKATAPLTEATRMDPAGGLQGTSYDMNDAEQIVGHLLIGGARHAYRWEGGMLADLHPPGALQSTASAIGPGGDVGGVVAYTSANDFSAALWSPALGSGPISLAPAGSYWSDVPSVNASLQVAVRANFSGSNTRRAYLWSPTTGHVDLGDLGGGEAILGASNVLSEAGQVVGTSSTASGEFHAFVWGAGSMTDLGAIDAAPFESRSQANDVNDGGLVVGGSKTPAGVYTAVKWESGVLVDLDPGNAEESMAWAVNNAGDIVGHRYSGGQRYATLWRDGVAIDLGAGPGGQAFLVNDLGVVVGLSGPATAPIAFVWTSAEEGAVTLEPRPGSAASLPYGLSDEAVTGMSCAGLSPFADPYPEIWWLDFTPPTPSEAIAELDDAVADLETAGTLNSGQAQSLSSKLEAIAARCDQGHEQAARNQLEAFIHHVEAWMASGQLSAQEGQHLLDLANALLAALDC